MPRSSSSCATLRLIDDFGSPSDVAATVRLSGEPRSLPMNAIRNITPTAVRLLLGLTFFVFGLNGFFHFLPQPPAPPRAAAFAGALFASGYFFPLLKTVEVAAG